MLSLRSRGIAISSSTIESQCTEAGQVGVSEDLSALLFLLPLFAVDRTTFYRYMGRIKYQWLTRRLQWCLQTTMESSVSGATPADLIGKLQQSLTALTGEYDSINEPAAHEQQERNYNEAERIASRRCFQGSFDS